MRSSGLNRPPASFAFLINISRCNKRSKLVRLPYQDTMGMILDSGLVQAQPLLSHAQPPCTMHAFAGLIATIRWVELSCCLRQLLSRSAVLCNVADMSM